MGFLLSVSGCAAVTSGMPALHEGGVGSSSFPPGDFSNAIPYKACLQYGFYAVTTVLPIDRNTQCTVKQNVGEAFLV